MLIKAISATKAILFMVFSPFDCLTLGLMQVLCQKKSIEPKSDAFSDETLCVSIAYMQLLQT